MRRVEACRPYNICVIQPRGYQHTLAFSEIAELLKYSLRELGYRAEVCSNLIDWQSRNIVLGCHLLDVGWLPKLPADSVIFNTEQILSVPPEWRHRILRCATTFETWDYSRGNLEALRLAGALRSRFFRIGWQRELARIPRDVAPDIDVLFYGSMTPRRMQVIDALRDAGLAVRAEFGVYGEARDALIARAKVVLNLHLYQAKLFEIVRVFYLMTNAKAVVAEVGSDTLIEPGYAEGIAAVPYEGIVETCCRLVADDPLRAALEARALAAIRALPQVSFTGELVVPNTGQS